MKKYFESKKQQGDKTMKKYKNLKEMLAFLYFGLVFGIIALFIFNNIKFLLFHITFILILLTFWGCYLSWNKPVVKPKQQKDIKTIKSFKKTIMGIKQLISALFDFCMRLTLNSIILYYILNFFNIFLDLIFLQFIPKEVYLLDWQNLVHTMLAIIGIIYMVRMVGEELKKLEYYK